MQQWLLKSRRVTTAVLVFVALTASLVMARGTALAQAIPTATLDVPSEGFIGEAFSFTVTFDNTSGTPTDTGYGPYINLILPKTGADGVGAAVDDGITFVNATYLGQTVTATVIEFDGSGNATHPYAVDSSGDPLIITGTPGNELVVLLLPFGSFTQGQPAAEVTVNVNLSNQADLGTPLNISASAGFQFGADPLDNPATDPSITGSTVSTNFTPTLFTLTKTYIGPEDETATGPNFPRQYLITVDIADGQTLTNLDLIDVLPDNLQFVQVDATTIRGTAASTTAVNTPSTTNPGGTLTRRFASVTGTTADNDATLLFTFYVPRDDLGGDRVIVPLTGDDVESINDASTEGNWDPIDTRDAQRTVESDVTVNDHTLIDKSIAIQKGVANVNDVSPTGNTPGDTLEYTLDFQISDFFAFESIVITDTFSDGQLWDATFAPELSVNGNTWTLAAADFNAANYTVNTSQIGNDTDPATDGSTTVYFRVSDEMITRGQDGKLIGGCIPVGGTGGPAPSCTSYNNGPTTATVTFRTVVQDEYSDTYPSGNPSLNENDALNNTVLVDGLLLSEANTAVRNGTNEADDSAAGINIAQGILAKTVYAVNGDTGADPTKIAPGDEVTYRLRYDLVIGDFELLSLTDFVPLPVFFVGDPNFDGTAGPAWSFDATGAATPPTGQWKRGPADTQFSRSATVLGTGIVPTTTIDIPANRVRFDYGTFDDPGNVPTTIDLLFTITASNEPFADRLFLTNQVRQSDQNTQNEITTRDAIVQIELTQPVITEITKGVIATNNSTGATFSPSTVGPVAFTAPGSAGVRWTGTITSTGLITRPVNSNLSGVDADDLVSFAIVIENTGTGLNGAFDVQISDTIPAGFSIPTGGAGLNLTVTDGTGAAIAYTNVGAGTGLFDLGIELTDPGPTATPTGAIDPYSPNSGRNIAVITYDLQVDGDVAPSAQLINTATLFNYAGEEDGPDHTPTDLTDDATVTIKAPVVDKTINGTNQVHTLGNDVAIGEILTYTVAITVPEGLSANAQLIDTLDNGLVFVDCLNITASAALTTTIGDGYAAICSGVTVSNQGRTATFDFGDITNSNRNNAVAEVITLTYRVVVINGGGNDRGDNRNNSASWEWDSSTASDSAPNVKIVEPTLSVDKTASPTTGDAGDVITYTLVLTHATVSNADTFNVVLSDTIPVSLTYVTGSLSVIGGTNPTTGPTITGDLIEATWDAFPRGTTTTIEFRATLNVEVRPGEVINNRVDVTYTSLPGDVTAPQTPNSSVSTERTGDPSDPGGNVNDYVATDTAPVTVNNVDLAKSIVATSESDTADTGEPDVTIGEIVRYRLTTSIPEGTSPDFQIQDYLPEGLTFLNDGTAQAALVSNGGDKLTLDPNLTCDSGTLERDATDPTNVSLNCVLPDTAVSSSSNPNTNNDVYNTGTDVYFRFGELTNSDTDNNKTEYVIIEFNALVDNTSQGSNDAGESRNNYYRVLIDGTQNGPGSNGILVNIVEPFVDINKDLLTVPSDADDVVTYTVTFTNTRPTVGDTSLAYNLLFTDTLPSDLTLDLNSIVVTATSSHVNNSADNSVLLTFEELPVGGVVEVTYSAKLKFDVMPGQQIDNQADVTYTSLPGTGTTGNPTGSNTPGGTGDSNGERDGSGGVNDYSDSDPASFTAADPDVVKQIDGTSAAHTADPDVTIGEVITYALTVTLPEGITPSLVITDDLPAGLSYVANSVAVDSSGFNGTLPTPSITATGGSGDDVIVTFGNISVTADNVTTNNSFIVRLQALVLDEVGNVGLPPSQTDLINNAAIRVGNNPEISANPVTVTVVEPQMVITKTMTPAQAAANDTLTIELVVQNTGESTAFDVIIDDPLPSITFTNLSEVSTPAGFVFSTVDASPDTIVRYIGGEIPVGEQRIFTFTAQLTSAVNAGDVYTNVATVTQATTLPGPDPNERDEPDVDAQDDVTIVAPDLTLTKDDGVTVLEPGQTTVYTLTVANIGSSDATGVVITDTVPVGTTFDAAGSSNGWSCADNAAAGTICTYNVGNLAVAADVDIFFAVTVDLPLAASVTSIVNVALVADDGSQGDDPTPSNNTDDDTDQVIVGALGDYVWDDVDFDGLQGRDEDGIDGVTVNLLNSNGDFITSTVTSGGGLYNFGGLGSGGYIVEFVLPDGYLFTQQDAGAEEIDSDADTSTGRTDVISLGQGETNNDIDAGLYQAVSLGDFVWDDLNGDGIQDPGEPGIPGVVITLSNGLTTTTDANGIYTFTNLVPGVYTITVDVPAGYVVSPQNSGADDTADSDIDSNGVSDSVTLVSGENNPTLDAGLFQPASLGDFVWDDLNADGIQDPGELGIPGVVITLSNGLTTTTDANGIYTFTNLVPGVYTVTVDVPAGYIVSPQNEGADDAADSDIDSGGVMAPVTLVSGENNPTLDAGLYQLASLGDFVWDDLNGDGIQDGGEPGIPGVVITLSSGLTTTTDANGIYTFTNLVPGVYTVTVDVPAGYIVSPQDSGADDTADSDIDGNGVSSAVTLVSGENNPTVDAGLVQPASLGDRVWEDLNGDGIQDGGEPGIPRVVVELFDDNGTLIASTTTDVNGNYTFTVAPGSYSVVFTAPTGYVFTAANQGSDDAVDSDADPVTGQSQTVTLVAGENNPTIDAGLVQAVNIGDTVWFDYNGDGLDTADEPGIGGVTVNLLDSLGNVISTTVTLADGTYLFPNLPPGTYTVAIDVSTLPPGLDNTYDLDGGNDSTATAVVPSGQDNLNFDFGYNAPPVIVATKTDTRIGDNDANGFTSPGDTLRYTVVLTNTGFSHATNVVFNDTPGENTTLVSGSVTASQGVVTIGNGAGDQNLSVAVGTLVPGAAVTITFDVQIAASLPAGVNQVANQGFVTSSELPDEPTDDPETPESEDPTVTIVIGTPRVVISKQIVGSTQVKLGDTLTYTIRITNTGNTVLTTVPLTDTFTTDYLDFVSAVPAPDVVDETAGFAHWADLTLAFGDLRPGDSFTVTTVMRASAVTPEGVTASNRATVANVTDEFDQTPPDGVVEGVAEVDISPGLVLTKSRIGSEVVEVGQEITYSIRITNVGETVIVTLPLSDSYDSQVLNFVRSQPAPTQMRPGLVEWADLTAQFGDLAPNASIEVRTVFTASQPISNTVNMAMVVNAVDEVGNLINAEDSATVTVASPAAVTLLSFTAIPEGNALRVSWVTGIEIDSWGFHLWRSETERPEDAVRVTGQMIPARGSATQGASYTHLDTSVVPGVLYHYWLEETELNGTLLRYGPIVGALVSAGENVQLIPRVYLPFVNAP